MGTQNFRVKNGLEVGSATTITSTSAYVGTNLSIAGVTTVQSDLYVDGSIYTPTLDVQGTASAVSIVAGDLNVSGYTTLNDLDVDGHTELDNVNISGIVTTFDLNVDGHTELDNLNVSGVSTFVGVVTSQSNVFVGNNLSVAGNARVVGILTVGSSSITLDGSTNTIKVGSGVTINTAAVSVNQLEVTGISTFIGISTFQNNVFVDQTLYSPALIVSGTSIADDIITRNINSSGIVTVTGTTDLNGDLDVDGHTELDNVNIAGILTAISANFNGNVTIGGTLIYEDVVNVDSIGIATARAGLRITGGGLDVVGVATFNNGVDIIGHTELDQLRVSGVSTFTGNIDANGNLDVDGHTELDNLNVSGVSTFVGIVTSQNNLYVGTDLSVAGNARVVGVLTVGSGTITLNGDTNTINVGSGVTINTTTSSFNQLKVAGISTFVGLSTFQNDVFIDGNLFVSSLNITGGTTLGDDIVTRNITASGIVTASSFDGDLNELGSTYYVATTGNDSNSGNNINEPYRTIEQALSVATNGDIIYVSAGTYEETCPLTVPRGVTIKGSGLRSTTIKPTTATKTNDVFLLNDITTLEDFTIRNSYFNSSSDTGYSFSYAPGIAITTRSPYIQRVTVLNTGSNITATDPYGYDTADSPPTSYIAGAGAKVDGSIVSSNSLEAGMLFNEVTFFTPNNKGIVLTNGARAEYLNCFHYFASQAIVGTSGTVGIAGTAETRLKFRSPSITPSVNDVVKLYNSGGSVVAVGTITNYNSDYARISGKGYGTFTSVGIGTTQDVRFFQSDGVTQTGIASAISLADYTMFGAEMRSVGCAVEYGSQGVVADGVGVQLRLFAMNFNHVGTGKDFSNDPTLVIQANEVVETNNGQVSYVSIDQGGDFRVGDSLYINQETGQVSFASTTYDLENIGNLSVTDGGSNQTLITPTSLTVGNLQLAANTFSSISGDINIDPAGSNETNVAGNLNVSGILTAAVIQVSALQKGDTSIALDDTGSDGTIRINTDGSEALRVTNSQRVGIGSLTPISKLDVRGGTQLDNVNVSGASTFVGVGTFNNDLYIGGNLYGQNDFIFDDGTVRNIIVTSESNLGISSATTLNVTGISTVSLLNVGIGGTIISTTNTSRVGINSISPNYTLDVNGDINFNGLLYQNNSAFVASRWSAGLGNDIYRLNGNVGIATTNPTSKLHVDGDVYISGVVTSTDYNSASDINLKENIQKIENPVEKVLQLNGVSFCWKKSGKPSMGVIAQEVEKVIPELVNTGDIKTVNYNGLIGLLIEVVKKQQEEISYLKTKIDLN